MKGVEPSALLCRFRGGERSRKEIVLSLTSLLILVAAGGFYGTPYWTVYQMQKAAQQGKAAALSAYADYPVLRKNLKINMKAALDREVARHAKDNRFELLAGIGLR